MLLVALLIVGLLMSALGLVVGLLDIDGQSGFGTAVLLVLVSGVSLSLASGYFLKVDRINENKIRIAVLVLLLLFGIAIRFIEFTYDRFDYDEYLFMIDTEQDLLNYVEEFAGNHSLQFPVHYWITYRIFGNSLLAYRFMSLLASLGLLLLAPLGIRYFWPAQPIIPIVVLSLLVLNGNAIYSTHYLFPYSNTFLLAAAIFFLFLRLAQRPLRNRQWMWLTIIFIPAAFFSNVFLIVPLAMGALSMFVFRSMWRGDSYEFSSLRHWIWELKPLIVFPLIYLAKQIIFPVTLWGAQVRVDHLPLYFSTSGYSANFLGLVKFILAQTRSLFWSMLAPAGGHAFEQIAPLFLLGCGFFISITLIQIIRGQANRQTMFTAFFFLATLLSLIIVAALGLYPYGDVRYIPYLTLPTAIMLGVGANWIYRWTFEKLQLSRSWKALLALLAIAILLFGGYVSVDRWRYIVDVKKSDKQAIDWLCSQEVDLIIVDNYIDVILQTKATEIQEHVQRMGWGKSLGNQDTISPEMVDVLTGTDESQLIENLFVVLTPHVFYPSDPYGDFSQRYPRWSEQIKANFELERSIDGAHIWVGLYHREGD